MACMGLFSRQRRGESPGPQKTRSSLGPKRPSAAASPPSVSVTSPSTVSGSSLAASSPTYEAVGECDFVSFPKSVQVPNLPVVYFNDEVEQQLIWEYSQVKDGQVQVTSTTPDIRVKNPVVMSNASQGFVVQPYELRYLHYRKVGLVFARPAGGRFMQPSIDTILVCRGLVDALRDMKPVQRLIDVGSGSGFIGKFAGHYAQGTGSVEVTLVDIDPVASTYYQSRTFNAEAATATGRKIQWKFCAEDAVALLEKDCDFDLIVSNPPYIPTKSEAAGKLSPHSGGFWEGVGLVVFLLDLLAQRAKPGTKLVLMVSSLTLKAPAVLEALERTVKNGCALKVLLERAIAWKAWYAGPNSLDHLLATKNQRDTPHEVAGCRLFLGATVPGSSRFGTSEDGRDLLLGYHWHMAYVLELQKAPKTEL